MKHNKYWITFKDGTTVFKVASSAYESAILAIYGRMKQASPYAIDHIKDEHGTVYDSFSLAFRKTPHKFVANL